MKRTDIPFFKEQKELYKFLVDNKETLVAEKKYFTKHGDCMAFNHVLYDAKGTVIKANAPVDSSTLSQLKVSVVINSTNIMDSHGDVHLPGLWKKSLSENKMIKFLQEHQMAFDHIIADKKELKAYTQKMSWGDLGFNYGGQTECLTFDATILKSRNPFMFDQYAKGYVDNHSVGMQYVTIVMCINEPDEAWCGAEYEAWQKYFPIVANQDAAEQKGYFWAVKEAKVIEGSAVPIGSNVATPTLDNGGNKGEPGNHSKNQPRSRTGINYRSLASKL